MNKLIVLVLFVLIYGCEKEIVNSFREASGTVFISGGIMDCHTWIELDNGGILFPQNWTDFHLVAGDRVTFKYEITTKSSSCNGNDCMLKEVTVLKTAHYVDLYANNYDSLKNDPVKINSVLVEGNFLVVNLSYGGGCKAHTIDLARVHPWCGTPLPPPTFELRHNANDDPCEAWFTNTFKFDISRLKQENAGNITFLFQAKEYDGQVFSKTLKYRYE